jgi:type IV pilus assembly protein PilV
MKNKHVSKARPARRQSGSMLLEALIAILVFSLGILTVIGIQAASIKLAGDAQLRTKAALLANQLIGEMWASGDKITDLKTKFESPDGSEYKKWLNCHVAPNVNDTCPITGFTLDPLAGLPGVGGDTLPTVAIDAASGVNEGRVQITLRWQTPSDEESHRHTVLSQIRRNK